MLAKMNPVHQSALFLIRRQASGAPAFVWPASSFQTTLGVRLTSRIALGNDGVLTPELRLGWNHEFLDASQSLSASLTGVAGSAFSATGIAFSRDAALIGAGFSLELSPDAKVFVDYDGRLGSRLQEHSVSGGLKVRF